MPDTTAESSYPKTIGHALHTRPTLLLLALVTLLALGWGHRTLFVDEAPSTSTEALRVVVVSPNETTPSTSGELRGTLVEGKLPTGVHQAEVLSDRNCAPDAEGISHCLNELVLGKTRITIRHHHRMGQVPCLRPGEFVMVMDEATYTDRPTS